MEPVLPKFDEKAFNCPHCNAYAHMTWKYLEIPGELHFHSSKCNACGHQALWHAPQPTSIPGFFTHANMIFPDSTCIPQPNNDMPEEVMREYLEAASVFQKSPRAAAALLRLGLQKLCKHLGEPGENINTDIRSMAGKGIFSSTVIKVADTVRLTGNNAVHPGEMSDEDVDYVASKMFDLLNFIVDKGISEPKLLQELYEKTPESKRKAAEEADKKRAAVSSN